MTPVGVPLTIEEVPPATPPPRTTMVVLRLRPAEVDALDRLVKRLGHAGTTRDDEKGRAGVLRNALDELRQAATMGQITRLDVPPHAPRGAGSETASIPIRMSPEEVQAVDELLRQLDLPPAGSRPGGRAGLLRAALHRLAAHHKIAIATEPVPPCARCGTNGGPALRGSRIPTRSDGRRLGVDGPICGDCYDQLQYLPLVDGSVPTAAPPCARCGTTGGRVTRGHPTPQRNDGRRFGVDGLICKRCYEQLRYLPPADGSVPASAPPCARCGTTGGRVSQGSPTPRRSDGRRFGVDGLICKRCYDLLWHRKQRAAAMETTRPAPEQPPPKRRGQSTKVGPKKSPDTD